MNIFTGEKQKIIFPFSFTNFLSFFFSLINYWLDFQYEKNDLYSPSTPQYYQNQQHQNNGNNNVNINLPDNNTILRLEVELRDKNTRNRHHPHQNHQGNKIKKSGQQLHDPRNDINYIAPMEKVSLNN